MKQYSEEDELTRYIFKHYSNFLTDTEAKAYRNILITEKITAYGSNPEYSETIRTQGGSFDDAEAMKAIEDGKSAFLIRTRNRILKDHTDQIYINRCSICYRIARTPKAQQCFWCGHDWHALHSDE